ncbi:PAS domain-containing protein [Botryobacter ruber]|uniref:PAS domain-containing protein n=1 Tax=Botryobacter ruber TaxID=2171629 RepID=UPI000E0BF760|nr:PAS domain-containing protein [Botryobacter ruber]
MDLYKLFVNIPETIVVISPEYKVLEATDAYLEATMRTREELIGQNFLEAFPDNPDSSASSNTALLRKSLDNALYGKKVDYLDVLRYDIPKPKADGGGFDIRYWEASHTPVLDEQGEVMFIIQRTSDVTEREITKLALSESQQKFRFMAEAMPQLVMTMNPKGELTYFNQRWTDYTGIPIKELLDTRWAAFVHPDDLPVLEKRWQAAFRAGTEFQAEMRLREKNGSYRWFLCRCLPMQDENGNILMWVGSSTDIHDTRQMVQELLESNEQMSHLSDQVQTAYLKVEAERKTLERLIMQAPAVFCILKGPEHRFELVNPYYQNLFPSRKLLGKPIAEALPEIVAQGFVDILDNVFQTGKEFVAEEIFVRLDKTGTGNLVDTYFTIIYQPLLDEEDNITGILVFGNEITEQVKYRQKLQELE